MTTLDENGLRAVIDTMDWQPEQKCEYCGDLKHEAASGCRSTAGHSFTATGRRLFVGYADDVERLITAYLAALPTSKPNRLSSLLEGEQRSTEVWGDTLPTSKAEPVGHVTDEAMKLMRSAKAGWHYHLISSQPDVDTKMEPTIPLYAHPPISEEVTDEEVERATRAYLHDLDIDPDYPHGGDPTQPAWWKIEAPHIRAALSSLRSTKP